MDPDTALRDFLDALRDGDRAGALSKLTFLSAWIATHGFLPKDPRMIPKAEMAEAMAEHLRIAAEALNQTAAEYETRARKFRT